MKKPDQKYSAPQVANHWMSRGTAALLMVVGLAMITTPASARWYKWVDESGNISYQDQPPPSDSEQAAEVLNYNGVTLQHIPSRAEELENNRLAKIEAEQRQRDDALIKAFPLESDLINTRDKRITHIDGSVSRMYEQLVILNSRLLSIEDRVNVRIERNLSPSQALESDRIAVTRSIGSTNALIKSKLRERRLVMSQFDNDLERYRNLKSGTTRSGATASLDE